MADSNVEMNIRIMDLEPFTEMIAIVDRLLTAARYAIDSEGKSLSALEMALDDYDEWLKSNLQ
jgi:hypothetical protein